MFSYVIIASRGTFHK